LLHLNKKLVIYENSDEAKGLMEEYKNIDFSALQQQCMEWSKLQTAIDDYITRGSSVQKSAEDIRIQYKNLSIAIRKIGACIDKEELFG